MKLAPLISILKELFRSKKGFNLVEALLAVSIFSLVITTFVGALVYGRQGTVGSGDRSRAMFLAEEGIEATRNIRDEAWNEIQYSQTGIATSSSEWIFDGEGTSDSIGKYTRILGFSDVCRDASDAITACPGIYTDEHTKLASSTVSWTGFPNISRSVNQVAYISNWESANWIQTDWIGSNGQTIWSDETRYDSDNGNVATSTAGQLSLIYGGTLDNGFDNATDQTNNWPFTTSGNYTFDSADIEVTGGFGQLKGSGGGSSGGTVDDGFEYATTTSNSWTFTTSGNYTFDSNDIEVTGGAAQLITSGGSYNSGTTTNESFTSDSSGWTYNDWSQGGGDPNATGTHNASGGNTGGYVDVSVPSNIKNKDVGGYWEQAITISQSGATVTCSFDWSVVGYTAADGMNDYQLYVFLDSATGEPSIGTQIWASGTQNSTTSWSGQQDVDCSSEASTSGTYYYKIAAWADGNNKNSGPITAGYDNAKVEWEHTSGGTYPTDEPSINPTASFSAPAVVSWDSFTETTTKNGGEIYYQLSSDDGSTWQYWNGSSWASVSASTDYNTGSVTNTNIGTFATSTAQINFKAFLESDGSQDVQLDDISIGYTPATAVWSFGTWDVTGGEETPVGTRVVSGGNPDKYSDINFPFGNNDDVGGYWEQAFTTTVNNPAITVDFDYKIVDYNSDPDVAHIRVYIDTVSGAPTTQVGSSISFSGEGAWTSATQIDASSAVTTAGTYYLKMAVWIDMPGSGSTGPYNVGFDNVDLSWLTSTYPTDEPSIYPTSSFTATGLSSWGSFTETATKNGGEVYYQLSNDDGSTWKYWNGSIWTSVSASTDYNTATVVNTNIGSFTTANEKIMFKAFLESDGSQLVKVDNIQIVASAATPIWAFDIWDIDGGEDSPTGSTQTSGGNPDGYADVTMPLGANNEIGGYWQQSFTNNTTNPTPVTLDFDYKVIDFNSASDVVDIRVYVDTTAGDPVTQVGSSISLSAEGSWTSATQYDLSSAVSASGLYYLKVGLWLETGSGGPKGPYTVGIDNAVFDIGNGTYPLSGTATSSAFSMGDASPVQIIEWDETIPTCSPTCSVIFQLRTAPDSGGSPGAWTSWYGATGATSYFTNSSSTMVSVDLNGNQWVQYKTDLTGDGSDTPVLQEIRVNYR
jgi:Tfp pilus assembly protein PilV